MKLPEVQALIDREGLDAFLFSSQANVFYLSRFRSTHAYVILTPNSRHLLTDARYYERAKKHLPDWDVVLIEGRAIPFLKKFLKKLGAVHVGYESDRMSCEFRKALRSTRIKWKPYLNFLRDIRVLKTEEELKIMKEGVKKSDYIYRELINFIEPGMSELRVRGFIVGKLFELNCEGESFPAIVASGEASAVPHWETSDNPIGNSSPLLVDMGLLWKGYCTDFTRTIYVGKPSEEFKRIYQIVKDAHLFALEKVKVGNRVGDVDRTARDYISGKGFGKFFTHSTGHGVGVEIHEYPRVYHKGEDASRTIEEGMVFTIEPGIYLPGKFGVRLENIIAVVDGKGEPLSDISLELVSV